MRRVLAYVTATFVLFLWMEIFQWCLKVHADPSGNFAVAIFWMIFVPPIQAVRRLGTERWIKKEAERWLALRMSGGEARISLSRRAWIFMPAAIALIVVMFMPEIMGIGEHLLNSRPVTVGEYRISVPVTWMWIDTTGEDGVPQTILWNPKGVLRSDRHAYLWNYFIFPRWALSFSTLEPASFRNLGKYKNELLQERFVKFGGRDMRCKEVEYREGVVCACQVSEPDLFIRFAGSKRRKDVFYEYLQQHVQQGKAPNSK